jgi:hypothetical protein
VKEATTTKFTVWDTGQLLQRESFINTLFPTLKELLCTDMASQIAAEMLSSPDSLSDLCRIYAFKLSLMD